MLLLLVKKHSTMTLIMMMVKVMVMVMVMGQSKRVLLADGGFAGVSARVRSHGGGKPERPAPGTLNPAP